MTTATMEKISGTTRGDEQWAHTRLSIYQMLSEFVIHKPSVHLLVRWQRILDRIDGAGAAVESFRDSLRGLEISSLPALCAIEEREYERLVGRRSARCVSLRESFYAGEEAERMAVRVRVQYERAGINLNKMAGEKDDELGVELEFMTALAERMTEGVRSREEQDELAALQLNFLEEHLLEWVPSFCAEVRKYTQSPLYVGLCTLMEEFIAADREWLSLRVRG
ncbi:molecular chaperone TorD family protein [Saccharibacillus sp. CPCC 101409]|uniref:TorD/DmsD family molecular chaperone n=1 Tax=Saccharibacillus sp. CPCC 101409 TaxID=3058041 RepID=UPI00267414DA|nr:molecular chaperone TorD family protein [Saccharibacillus sp. CPCC 101409]MDO3412151.1 molecular chaperone TorD family protein [Saccharibacillus sp. CPCC 101409]